MALDLFWMWSAIGLTWLLNLVGALVLILPGRYDARGASRVGLGRHVEALILVSFAVTLTVGGFGQVPVWFGDGGVVAVSLLGAVVPSVLALHFLLNAGIVRLVVSIVPLFLVAATAFLISRPVEGVGIIALPPWYYLPALTAGIGGLLVAGRRLGAVPLGFAYGSLGGLIGADLARWEWITGARFGAASIGGAEAMDLVFLMGLWGAAIAAVPLLGTYLSMRRPPTGWAVVAEAALAGRGRTALLAAEAQVESALAFWARQHGQSDAARDDVLTATSARPVVDQIHSLLATAEPWDPATLRRTLENAEGLTRRLSVRVIPDAAPVRHRLAAGAIDLVPVLAVAGVAGALAFGAFFARFDGIRENLSAFTATAIFVVWLTVAVHVLVPLATEWATGGRTLGKALVGLRVRHVEGRRLTGWDFITRNLARLIDIMVLYIIPLVARAERGRQRLGDHFANTYVARANASRATVTIPPVMHPASATRPSHEATRPPL